MINQGAKFMVYVNSTNAKSSGGSPVLIEETASFSAWKRYEATLDIPDDMWLRFEIKILQSLCPDLHSCSLRGDYHHS